jgi:hypothetical protein
MDQCAGSAIKEDFGGSPHPERGPEATKLIIKNTLSTVLSRTLESIYGSGSDI